MLLSGNREALLRRRGWLYIVADAPQLARHDFEAAIRLDATNGDAYNGRGFARVRLGEHRQAAADAEKALAVGEPKPDLYYKAARVYAVAAIAAAAEVRKKGQETVTLGLAISGSRRGLAPRDAQATPCRTPPDFPERRHPQRPPVAAADPPHCRSGSGRAHPVRGQVIGQADAVNEHRSRAATMPVSLAGIAHPLALSCPGAATMGTSLDLGKHAGLLRRRRATNHASAYLQRDNLPTPAARRADGRPHLALDLPGRQRRPTAAPARSVRRSSIPTPRPARPTRSTLPSRAPGCRRSPRSLPCPRSPIRS